MFILRRLLIVVAIIEHQTILDIKPPPRYHARHSNMLVYQKVMILKVSLHRFSIRLNNDEGKICMNFPRFNRCSSGNVSGIKAQLRRWRRISVPEFLFHRPLNLVHMYISGHQDKHSKTQIQRRHTEGKCQKYFLMAFSSVVSLRSELACKAKRLKRSAG